MPAPDVEIVASNFMPADLQPADACTSCTTGESLGFQFSYAYQPIVDVVDRTIYAHEALVRGPAGEPAPTVLSRVNEDNCYRFDQACRAKAIKTAAALSMSTRLSINFMPNAIYRPEVCIRATLAAAKTHHFPIDRIIFETVEGERVTDAKWFAEVLREYKRIGFLTAIDDFGAGFAGLNLLADFLPDLVKLDMDLIRGIDQRPARRSIVHHVTRMCSELGVDVIAEGVETPGEYAALRDAGIRLIQGYLFGRPQFEAATGPDAIPWLTDAAA